MAVNGTVTITIKRTGDLNNQDTVAAPANASASGAQSLLTLSSGFNSISVPTGGSTPTEAIIQPPAGNTQSITLKGITGDTGIVLHKTRPTVIALDSSQSTIGLTAGGTITGLRIFWN